MGCALIQRLLNAISLVLKFLIHCGLSFKCYLACFWLLRTTWLDSDIEAINWIMTPLIQLVPQHN